MRLNYHHLRYFQEVAREGNLTRAAARLNLSQSALSTQIRQLEERLGHALFERTGRAMILTEAGRIALDHAERIFDVGDDLVATLTAGGAAKAPLRVGALSTLSRNFQLRFLRPALAESVELVLSSGNSQTLLRALEDLALDVVLLTDPPPRDSVPGLSSRTASPSSLSASTAPPVRLAHDTLADLLAAEPVILPTESSIRTGFDSLVARLGVTPRVAADRRRHGHDPPARSRGPRPRGHARRRACGRAGAGLAGKRAVSRSTSSKASTPSPRRERFRIRCWDNSWDRRSIA